ncbi:MAG: T9SS type A sorting domain-containing protein, partial [Bacteroidales bacterium]
VNGNELRIGWYSSTPINLNETENLLTLKLKSKPAFSNGAQIKFVLAANPLNELADGQFDVINNAILDIDLVNSITLGITNQQSIASELKLSNQPNPFNGNTMINYSLPFNGTVSLEVFNYIGVCVKVLVSENQLQGNYKLKFDANSLPSGIYMAKLILKNEAKEMHRSIKLICNH